VFSEAIYRDATTLEIKAVTTGRGKVLIQSHVRQSLLLRREARKLSTRAVDYIDLLALELRLDALS